MKNVGRKLLSIGLMLTMMFCCVSTSNYLAIGVEENSQICDNDDLLEELASAKKEAEEAKQRLGKCLRDYKCKMQLECLDGDEWACEFSHLDRNIGRAEGVIGVMMWRGARWVVGHMWRAARRIVF